MSQHRLSVRLLGGFELQVGPRLVPAAVWRQRRAAAIIKLLALEPGHRLHREQIRETLWPEMELESAANNLRVALHYARHALEQAGAPAGVFLARDGDGLILGPPDQLDIDVARFTAAVSRAWQDSDPTLAAAAVALYRGELLPEDRYEDWAASRREGLRASYLTLLHRLAGLHEQRGDLVQAVAARELALAGDPLEEATYAALMRLHVQMGNHDLALARYTHLETILDRELQTVPAPETQELVKAIRQGRFAPPAPAAATLPLAPSGNEHAGAMAIAPRARLPAAVDDLVGRERELAEIARLLTTTRLVTLTGPGGTGKTRLALETARVCATAFPEGVAFVDLAPLREATLVLPTVALALGIEDSGERSLGHNLAAAIDERRVLLVLDNFEQVTTAAPSIATLLRACPHLTVLATSRVRLRLSGEHEYPVSPLALPERSRSERNANVAELGRVPAVRLFTLRARAARPAFALTDANVAPVVAVCRRLDGLPLAIELAAARVRILTPDQLLRRLDRPLDALDTSLQDVAARQRTLRNTIAWSYDLLTPAEQALFLQLSIFAGGWTLEAAEAIARPPDDLDVFDGLASLIDKSLVRRDDRDQEPRFGILETIREFALDRLRREGHLEPVIARAHAAYYLQLAEKARWGLVGHQQEAWFVRLDAEDANIRAALAWTMTTDAAAALQFSRALWRYWTSRGRMVEGRTWLEQALILPGADAAPLEWRADAHNALGNVLGDIGEYTAARHHHEQALALRRELADADGIAASLNNLGLIAIWRGNYDHARALLEESLAILQTLSDPFGMAIPVSNLGDVMMALGDFARAHELHEEALRLRELAQDAGGCAYSVFNLGEIALFRGDLGEAGRRLTEGLRRFQALGDTIGTAYAEWRLADLASRTGDEARAAELLRSALRTRRRMSDQRGIVECLEGIAIAAIRVGADRAGVRLLGVARARRTAMACPLPPSMQREHEREMTWARKRLGAATVASLLDEGSFLAPQAVLTLARETLDELAGQAAGPSSPS